MDVIKAADGKWFDILTTVGGISPDFLQDKHGPCPACGGTDRFRWDDLNGTGSFFCNRCGSKDHAGGAGSGLDLLMRVRGWSLADACGAVERHLGLSQPVPAPPIAGAEHVWRYSDTFVVTRFPGKRIRPLWWDGTAWRWKAPPSPRPLYWARHAVGTVLITEGEKAADAAAQLFPSHAVCTWPSGCKAIDKADWQPLRGRTVVLWPDADAVGREAMAKLAGRLLAMGCSVTVVNVPANLPDGWDLADALSENWTPKRAAAAVERFGKAIDAPAAPAAPPPPAPPPAGDPPPAAPQAGGQPFTCLGFDGDNYFYLPRSSGQVARISRGSHNETNLVSLCPEMAYWETLYPSKNGVNWTAAKASLFARQHAAGVFDRERIRGRGAWLDDGRVVFHLGDRLIVDGQPHSVLSPPPSRFFYEQSRHLDGPGAEPLDDERAVAIMCIADRFKWESPAWAQFLLGWTVLAPVCGALNWRPHIWITGGAGTGKTTILKAFMRPLMGGVLQTATGGTTEPGLRGILKSDAIPVVFDEFEQNEAKDKAIVQNVLSLARVASSEGGKIYKGTTTGGATSYEIRSMFCVSSINVSLIQKADVDRFCVLGLRRDRMNKDEWLDFEREILAIATVDNGRALIARTLTHLPTITENARVLGRALGRRFGQRFGDQHGTLLAGAWSLHPGGGGLLDQDGADAWVESLNWSHQEEDPGESDEIKCRDTILQQIVRYGGGLDASLGEIVEAVASGQALGRTIPAELTPILGRYGLKVFRAGERLPLTPGPDGPIHAQVHCLAIANRNAQLQQLLRNTPWSSGAHRSALRRIPNALAPDKPAHFAGVGTDRCTLIPLGADDQPIA